MSGRPPPRNLDLPRGVPRKTSWRPGYQQRNRNGCSGGPPNFPKHPLHKIVCIGALVGSRQPEGWRVGALGAPHVGERPEAKQAQMNAHVRASKNGIRAAVTESPNCLEWASINRHKES
jgi:hypothetical protein